MSLDFSLLAEHMQTLLGLSGAARDRYIDGLPPDAAAQVRELLQFESATLDLSHVPALELALDVLAQPLPEFIGRWRVQRLLGRGGMASVYLVERSEGAIRQLAACKIGHVRTELEDGLRRETATLLDLGHPGIATVLDFGHVGERPYMVSEFVEGADIVAWAQGKALPLAARLRLFEDVLSAAAYAHERLLLHQDIKPANVLVDTGGRPRLIDFGLATMLGGRGDSPVAGYTPRFASPEQKRNVRLTVRSDIYSLGVTLKVLLEDVAPARGLDDVQAVIAKACQEAPEARYASATAMAADLRAARESRPVTARAGGAGYRLLRFAQRHPQPVALGVLLVLSAALGIAATVWQARRAVAAAQVAETAAASAQTVQDFLVQDILGRANPADSEYDPSLGIVGVIDAAARGVDRRFVRDRRASAAVHGALASIYRSLGRYDEAFQHASVSVRQYEAALGAAHELTLGSRYLQVRTLASGQRLDEAARLLDETDRLAGERLGAQTRLALAAALARALTETNRLRGADALAAYQRAIALRATLDPDDFAMDAFLQNGLAEAHLRMGQAARAVVVLEALPLESYSRMNQAGTHRNLAWAHRELGAYDDALRHGQRAIELYRDIVGGDHYSTLAALGTLSYIHHLRKDCAAALAVGREAAEGMTRVYGTTRQSPLIERGNFGSKQFECGEREEGLRNLLAAVAGLREHYGATNAAAQSFAQAAADYLAQSGRPAEALAQLEGQPDEALREEDARAVLDRLQEAPAVRGNAALQARLDGLRTRVDRAPTGGAAD